MTENENKCCGFGFSRLTPEASARLASSMHSMISCDKSPMLNGMTIAEFSLMLCMERYEYEENSSITVAEAASRLNVSVPAISRLLNKLQVRGYIERRADTVDRRSVRIAATQQGRELFSKNKRNCIEIFDRVLRQFTDEELRLYSELQSKFADNMVSELDRLKKEHSGQTDKG
ncbi:MAG: MarR family winged helix-turn-helix transcriptional regulator [Oscillospiraceae bacterium]